MIGPTRGASRWDQTIPGSTYPGLRIALNRPLGGLLVSAGPPTFFGPPGLPAGTPGTPPTPLSEDPLGSLRGAPGSSAQRKPGLNNE
jgi:hypothetical protein